jgi:hypothetical protein
MATRGLTRRILYNRSKGRGEGAPPRRTRMGVAGRVAGSGAAVPWFGWPVGEGEATWKIRLT